MDQESRKTSLKNLATPVQFLKGVGPQRAEVLERLDLRIARDLLFFFPRDYQDMSRLESIENLQEGNAVSVCGVVEDVELRNSFSGRSILGVLIRQDNQYLQAIWFNQPFLRRRFFVGLKVLLSGQPRFKGGRWQMVHPQIATLKEDESPPSGQIFPLYRLTEGISQHHIRRIVHAAVEQFVDDLEEVLPANFLKDHALWPIRAALREVHQPTDQEKLQQARRRFVYQELFVLQLALAMRRHRLIKTQTAPSLPANARINARILRLFPFELTDSQQEAIRQIADDMKQAFPMNRLLQGDVGSGKTVVAIYAMLLAVAHGCQAVLMAPTEVLARQHMRILSHSLNESRVRMGLLTGGLGQKQRQQTLDAIAAGEIDLVIGTHAIVYSEVAFSKLGLVVIDEQHKFGVRQRAQLRQTGDDPHYLVMTATPIPRTVSMTLFGDLEVSTLRQSPPNRQPVYTYVGKHDHRSQWWQFFRDKLREGRQGYVVTPLVDDSDSLELASVQQAFEQLANEELAEFRLDLLHGRMSPEQKETAMVEFAKGKTQVLVTTSVVEVGIDVPNATLMTIESGERFGLSQLHQLRGRVSRGSKPGHVCVYANPTSPEAQQRLEAFAQTNDGFELAEIDFALRGPGDLFSTKQHGLPPLLMADLIRDHQVLAEARQDAQQLTQQDPQLCDPAWARLKRMVLARYGKVIDLGDVG